MERIAKLIKGKKKIGITCHTSPDGDALGSVFALTEGLQSLGLDAYAINKDDLPDHLNFLPGYADFLKSDGRVQRGTDLVMALDCGNYDRLNLELETLGKTSLLVLDHHASNDKYGDYNHVNPKASATGELVFDLLEALGVKLSQTMAVNLYTALATDTGSFRYECTTPRAHHQAARLLEAGVDFSEISRRVFDEKPLNRVRLLGLAIQSLESHFDGKVSIMTLTDQDFAKVGLEDKDTGDIVNMGLAPKEALVSLILKEQGDKVRVSLRTKRKVDAGQFAGTFQGGGHARAAGLTLATPSLREAKAKLLRELEAYLY